MAAYSLTLQATDGSSTASTSLDINLIDTDTSGDSLVCVVESIHGRVLEGALNSQTPLPACFSGDGSMALVSELTFTITDGNADSLFEIGPPGTISNTAALDYEIQTIHTLTVAVTNSEPVPRTGVLLVIITVDPVNEFPPVFSMDIIVMSVLESVSVGTIIGRLEASDGDEGLDGIITYNYSQTPSSIVFIHPNTGSIVLTNTLDFESAQMHNVTVMGTDSSTEPSSRMSSSALLSVAVRDANDNPPAFSRALYTAELREDSDRGHQLVTLVCDARDTSPGSAVTYTIARGNEDGTFNMDASMGLITLGGTLDFDSGPRIYSLNVECRENQPPHMVAESLVLIEVTSFNEFFPDPGIEYIVNVREDTPPGTQILQVQGRDRDFGLAGVLRYFIDNSNSNNANGSPTCPDNLFMDVITGTLYLMSEFDHEMGSSSYHCILSVWDSERPIHISEQDIFVTVVDVNDAVPSCVPFVRSMEVAEDTPIGQSLLTLSCSDPDSASLQYSLLDSTVTRFTLSPGGELRLGEELDYETQSLFIVSASVSDGEHAINTTMYVIVTGVNEYTPAFATNETSCSVLENSIPGSPVCAVLATDGDDGEEGVIRYEFSMLSSMFEIDANTGAIFVVGEVDREAMSSHVLVVMATDSGSPALSSQVAVNVSLSDENDNSPTMAVHMFADVAENSPIGTLVATLECTDADEVNTPNSDLTLEIADVTQLLADGTAVAVTTPLFTIASPTGELTTLVELDYEHAQSYYLSVICHDQGLPPLATPTTVRINVAPVNEYTPTFAQARFEVTIPETTAVGVASILSLSATDGDAGEQGDITYSISNSSATPFWIDPLRAMLYVVEQLQCDVETSYSLTVLASDGGVPPLQSSVEVAVNIDPCLFGQLIPSASVYVADVMENSPVGAVVASVQCSSSRTLPFLAPSYMIQEEEGGGGEGGAGGVFEIDANTGDIIVLSQPDYEQATSHLLHVRCFDSNRPDTYADVIVHLSILPINEYTPTFPENPYILEVSESAELGSVIAEVQAIDGDAGMDGEVTYSIQDTSEVFIDRKTGEIYLARGLDREASDTLTITVTATDDTRNPLSSLSSHKVVTINIMDSNDNWPVCSRTVYHIHTSPQAQPPEVVFSELNCSDADLGPNSDLTYSLGVASEKFSIDSTTGVLSLSTPLDPEDAVTYRVPVVVRDNGATPLSITLLLIIDLQEPPLDLPSGSISDEEYISLVEAEGRKNSVIITLTDFSRPIVS